MTTMRPGGSASRAFGQRGNAIRSHDALGRLLAACAHDWLRVD